ncbi:MAG: hypothetical protein WA347_03020 [Rhabdochlamydiaceae bacterium]|jgi:hypothetical protein
MTIYLPADPVRFRDAFDAVCNRILDCKQDVAFYILFVELATQLREHPVLKDYILGLESKSVKQKEEFSIAALETLEDSWVRLWKYHRHSLKHLKQLIHIKRIITAPEGITFSLLYNRICFRMWEFRCSSPFFRFIYETPKLFRAAQSKINLASSQFDHFYPSRERYFAQRKIILCKLSKKDKRRDLHKKIFVPMPNKIVPFKRSAECMPSAIFSQKTEAIEKKFFIPGQNDYEKRQNMQIMAETNPAFCWERIQFLQQCYGVNENSQALMPSKGRWSLIREMAWKSAQERCAIEALLGAKMALKQKLSHEPCSSIDSFLMCEHQIHRGDYEKYLQSLKSHIEIQLFRIQDAPTASQVPHATPALPQLERLTKADQCRIERENFIVEHAKKYRAEFPLESHCNMFKAYKKECPQRLLYAMTKWKGVIKNHKLDPRTPKEKKKNAGRP